MFGKTLTKSLLTAGLIASSCVPVLAHHSFSATFQRDARITIEGEVTRVIFKNPHVLIYMDVSASDGSVSQWVGEGASAISHRRGGWTADTISVGDYIRVFGDSTHDGSPMVSLEAVWALDPFSGEVLETLKLTEEEGGINPFTAPLSSEYHELPLTLDDGVTPNFEAIWSYRLPAQTEGARLPALPYSEAGAARKAAFDVRHDLQVFCDLPGAFRQIFQNPYPITFTQGEDVLTIEYEEYAVIRQVPFADAPLDTGIMTRLGTSAARYEGNELVIETINFLENPGTTAGDYVSDQARIIERYRRGDDAEVGAIIEIDATVYDPVYLTEPYTVSRRKSIIGGYQYTPHECESPLREREVVSRYMSVFAVSTPPADSAQGAEYCESLASSVGQGGKGWTAARAGGLPDGIFYDATGELVSNKVSYITQQGEALAQISASQLMCFATKDFVAPLSSQTTNMRAVLPERAGAEQDAINNKSWLYILGALLLAGLGFLALRRKKT